MKVISYSLWGNRECYISGALECIIDAKHYFPGWQPVFYCDDTVSERTRQDIQVLGGIVRMMPKDNMNIFWRLYAISESQVEVVLSRDTDSRPSLKEAKAVEEWLATDKVVHSMHDHPHHNRAIMGGTCGFRGGIINDMYKACCNWADRFGTNYGSDEYFLDTIVLPALVHRTLMHNNSEVNEKFAELDQYGLERRLFPVVNEDVPGGFIGARVGRDCDARVWCSPHDYKEEAKLLTKDPGEASLHIL